ncbi:MAG TPA: MOSC domain-containing protein [Tepidisphaeraceae bacterium]|nr:MOSC domain-containing protein [Tepidisphaeraceae bacterium]
MNRPILQSIQVGKPQSYGSEDATDAHDKPWTSGFFKAPVEGKIFAGRANLEGDGQADLKHHGGVDKAVLAYSADHYRYWRRDLDRFDLPFGAFAENLTIAGLDENSVHIGDVYSIGDCVFEVSQPRQPCWKLARRWRMNELVPMVIANGWSGWYLRVLEVGYIEPQMPVTLIERINPDWPISRANRIMNHYRQDLDLTLRLAAVPRLAFSWVKQLNERAEALGALVSADMA